jgi:hypothetical protein
VVDAATSPKPNREGFCGASVVSDALSGNESVELSKCTAGVGGLQPQPRSLYPI